MLRRLKRTHRRNLPKLARKQEMLRRLKKTHRRNLQKLAQKQEMLKRLKKACRWYSQKLAQKLARKRDIRLKMTHWRNLHKPDSTSLFNISCFRASLWRFRQCVLFSVSNIFLGYLSQNQPVCPKNQTVCPVWSLWSLVNRQKVGEQ